MNEYNEEYILSRLDMLENSLNELSINPVDKGKMGKSIGNIKFSKHSLFKI